MSVSKNGNTLFPKLLTRIVKIVTSLLVMRNQVAIQKLLQTKLTEYQGKNPSYSLRAFSRKVGLSPASASLILNGKRSVSRKLAQKICNALLLDPQEKSEILALFPKPNRDRSLPVTDAVDPNYLQLMADHFHTISEWYYFGILSLVKTRGFKNDPKWIASRLGISVSEASQCLQRLKRLEMLVEDETGNLARAVPRYRTSDDVTNASVRKAHFQALELAKRSLENDPVDRRDFTNLTLAVHPDRLPEAKVMIRKFQDELDQFLESPGLPATEVYKFCVQLFPVTQKEKL
jgi:uncharacterized protein (TIGR02147 family)